MANYQLFCKLPTRELQNWRNPINFKHPQIVDIIELDNGQLGKPKNLRYFKQPRAALYPLDLNEGFEDYTFRIESYYDSNLTKIEKYVMEKEIHNLDHDAKDMEKCKIYASRSVLDTLLMAPYTFSKRSFVHATKFNDIFYLSLKKGYYNKHSKTKNDSYHFKFKQFCFSDSPATEPETNVPIDENKQTYCIFRTQLQNFDITYSAEICGVASEREIKDLNNIDAINRCRFVLTKLLPESSLYNNKKKLKWWLQALLSGTDDIYFGLKNKSGKVCSPIHHLAAKDIPKNQEWKPDVCIQFLHTFLNMLKAKMCHVNCPQTVFEFQYDSAKNSINYQIHEGRTKDSFLTDQFVDHLRKHHK